MSTNTESSGIERDGYSVEITETTHRVLHITAENWGSLGYGQGWGCARDQLPVLADQINKVNGTRAMYLGAGPQDSHLASDFGYRMLGLKENAATLKAAQPGWIQELVAGYVAGYNRAVLEVDLDALAPWCRNADWIRTISEADLYAHIGDIALMASGRNLVQLIGRAVPPGPDGPAEPSPMASMGGGDAASNGWAVGGDVSAGGRGMVLANPHFPWQGEGKLWECHLRIPGEYDVYGVCLLGTPGIQIGFNQSLGWAHTFSRGFRFTLERLDLVEGSPTTYRYGDEQRDMTSVDHVVEVLNDGELESVEQTMWNTHYGPMLNMPLLGWGEEIAFSFRDANANNQAVLEQFLRMGMASSVGELRQVFHEVKGLPWVNTMAADADGDAWYTDASATPKLTQEAEARFLERLESDLIAALLFEQRIAMLDGSDPHDEWQSCADGGLNPREDGLQPPDAMPEINTRSVVVNANDSHWLNAPGQFLDGYTVMGGREGTPRTLRTRHNLRLASEMIEKGSASKEDLLELVFNNRSLSAELLRDQVVQRLEGVGVVEVGGYSADVSAAAKVLADWDLSFNRDAVGATLWREFIFAFPEASWLNAGELFADAFDPSDPVAAPSILLEEASDPAGGQIAMKMATALAALNEAGIDPRQPLGEVQWIVRNGDRLPAHGGQEGEGVLNVLGPVGALAPSTMEPIPAQGFLAGRERTGLADGGYSLAYGTSFLMALEFTDQGPDAVGLLAYGQSCDPLSPHHSDGTEAYVSKTPRKLRYTSEEIAADPNAKTYTISS